MTNDLWRLSAVRSLEVVRISEVKMYAVNAAIGRGHVVCPLYGGCPLLGVSIIGGSTVVTSKEPGCTSCFTMPSVQLQHNYPHSVPWGKYSFHNCTRMNALKCRTLGVRACANP